MTDPDASIKRRSTRSSTVCSKDTKGKGSATDSTKLGKNRQNRSVKCNIKSQSDISSVNAMKVHPCSKSAVTKAGKIRISSNATASKTNRYSKQSNSSQLKTKNIQAVITQDKSSTQQKHARNSARHSYRNVDSSKTNQQRRKSASQNVVAKYKRRSVATLTAKCRAVNSGPQWSNKQQNVPKVVVRKLDEMRLKDSPMPRKKSRFNTPQSTRGLPKPKKITPHSCLSPESQRRMKELRSPRSPVQFAKSRNEGTPLKVTKCGASEMTLTSPHVTRAVRTLRTPDCRNKVPSVYSRDMSSKFRLTNKESLKPYSEKSGSAMHSCTVIVKRSPLLRTNACLLSTTPIKGSTHVRLSSVSQRETPLLFNRPQLTPTALKLDATNHQPITSTPKSASGLKTLLNKSTLKSTCGITQKQISSSHSTSGLKLHSSSNTQRAGSRMNRQPSRRLSVSKQLKSQKKVGIKTKSYANRGKHTSPQITRGEKQKSKTRASSGIVKKESSVQQSANSAVTKSITNPQIATRLNKPGSGSISKIGHSRNASSSEVKNKVGNSSHTVDSKRHRFSTGNIRSYKKGNKIHQRTRSESAVGCRKDWGQLLGPRTCIVDPANKRIGHVPALGNQTISKTQIIISPERHFRSSTVTLPTELKKLNLEPYVRLKDVNSETQAEKKKSHRKTKSLGNVNSRRSTSIRLRSTSLPIRSSKRRSRTSNSVERKTSPSSPIKRRSHSGNSVERKTSSSTPVKRRSHTSSKNVVLQQKTLATEKDFKTSTLVRAAIGTSFGSSKSQRVSKVRVSRKTQSLGRLYCDTSTHLQSQSSSLHCSPVKRRTPISIPSAGIKSCFEVCEDTSPSKKHSDLGVPHEMTTGRKTQMVTTNVEATTQTSRHPDCTETSISEETKREIQFGRKPLVGFSGSGQIGASCFISSQSPDILRSKNFLKHIRTPGSPYVAADLESSCSIEASSVDSALEYQSELDATLAPSQKYQHEQASKCIIL